MLIIPAIDLRDGGVVRLAQGDYARETRYATDALELARTFADAGAVWLHVVDLDGARSGELENLRVIESIAATGLRVQAGGGVRGQADVERLHAAGVERVVVGSVAVREPATVEGWLARFGSERLCIALDTKADASGRWTLPATATTIVDGADATGTAGCGSTWISSDPSRVSVVDIVKGGASGFGRPHFGGATPPSRTSCPRGAEGSCPFAASSTLVTIVTSSQTTTDGSRRACPGGAGA